MSDGLKPPTPKKQFINNIAKIESVLPLLSEDDSKFSIDGYTHKDGTKVLLSERWEYDHNDDGAAEGVSENQGRVVLVKGNDYLCFSHRYVVGYDYMISELQVSIGKTDQSTRETIAFKGYPTISMDSSVEENIARILKVRSPALHDEYRKYVPYGVSVMNTLRNLRSKQNIQQYRSRVQSAAEKKAARALFDKAFDTWKIVK